jgi:hypothetical protein
MGVMSGTESRTDLLFKSADGTKVVLLDVTPSGTSKSASSTRKKLIFFGIKLTVRWFQFGGWKGE